jgi:multiple sugar transport system substrate-binding protein
MFKKHKIRKISILIIFTFIITSGLGCKGTSTEVEQAIQPVNLVYWRVFDDGDSMSDIIAAYNAIHPNISISYRKLRIEEYENELLNAFAEDRGPDLFSIHNTWTGKYENKIVPLPKTITLPYETIQGTIQKEKVIELRTLPSLSVRELQGNFVDAVPYDVLIGDQIYGLPLALDTMVLFYNKNFLNNAGIPQPPATWTEFREQVKKMTKQDKQGNITQAGAAIGTNANVERSVDILSLLMMQNGIVMTDNNGYPRFGEIPPGQADQSFVPGEEALNFYTDFASPAKEVYTWNNSMPDSLETFISGNVGFFFGYSYQLSTIKARAPKLNWGIVKMPQIEGAAQEINYANYWNEAVSKKSQHQSEAWDFIQFATKAENAQKYLAKTAKPTALRSLIPSQLEDINLNAFASQVLTAKSWYKGEDAPVAEKAFGEMIDSVVQGTATPHEAIGTAISKINQTINKQQ